MNSASFPPDMMLETEVHPREYYFSQSEVAGETDAYLSITADKVKP